jgi:hypothetical protein
MIKKSILVFIVLFLLYNYIVIPFYLKSTLKNHKAVQSQWQENKIRAQEYVYNLKPADKILVGSSLSERIADSSWYNLSFLGGSPLTGLELIKLKNQFPNVVLIETNLIARKLDAEIISIVEPSIFNKLTSCFSALLEKNQPFKFIGAFFCSDRDQKETSNPPDSALFNKLIQIQINSNLTVDCTKTLDNNIAKLQELVAFLEKQNVRIYFIQMPIYKTIYLTLNESNKRSKLFKAFPQNKYNWIIPDSTQIYNTTDGVHLTEKSAVKFKEQIKNRMKKKLLL